MVVGVRLGPTLAIGLAGLFLASCAEVDSALDRLGIIDADNRLLDEAAPIGGKIVDPPAPEQMAPPTKQPPAPTVQPETQLGSGEFINPPGEKPPARSTETADGLSLNFVDTDVREVVRSVLGGTLKLNYVIDPKIQGLITLQTSRPIPMAQALSALESALRLNGIAIVESNGVYSVVPSEAAARGQVIPKLRPSRDRSKDAYGVQIVPLRHISATEMAKILEPVSQKGAILRTDSARNLLMLAGTFDERNSMTSVVQIFDVDWLAGMSFALVPLRFADAKSVAADLEKVFDSESESGVAKLLRFVPIERMNAVLTLSPRPEYVTRAKKWIKKFDIGSPIRDRRLYVYAVQNGLAVDLAAVLSQVFGGTYETTRQADQGRLAPGLRPGQISSSLLEPTGSRQTTGGARNRPGSSLMRQRSSQGTFQQDRGRTQTTTGQQAGTARARLNRPGARPRSGRAAAIGTSLGEDSDIRIIANDINNSLLILATPNQYLEIEAALKRLDIVPLQVLIEATIAEVTLDDQLKYGVKWFFDTGDTSITLSDVASGAVNPVFPGFSVLFSSSSSVRVVLDALDSVTDVNVISSPQLMVLDNRTAELLVGDQVPVATQSSVSTLDPDAPIVNSIEFRDTGVVLHVTPRVNASGLVNMEIEQEVSDVVPTTTSGIDSPTIRQRRIRSSVAIQSGETVALGGLIRNRRTDKSDGVPFLSRIPLFGVLFGSKENKIEKTELLVLITPRVVRNKEQARDVTEELRKRIDAFSPKKKPQ